MNRLRNLQHEFLQYLLNDASDNIIKRIESSPQRSAEQRMQYYGTAYSLRLQEVLRNDYEQLHAYLGDDLFETLMFNYINRYPSRHPNLRYFGQHMVELVEQLEPFNQHPEVAEIARIEQAFANSFDAADNQHIALSKLAELSPSDWANLQLRFHDSVQLLPQTYNSFQIWQALSNDKTPPDKTLDDMAWVIWRADLVSRYRSLQPAERTALSVALSSGSFAEVCSALLEHYSEQDTPLKAVAYLQQWIADHMLCELGQR
ncbi:DNA-binding domain-containing protein [Aestuariirhabdus sp. Z084]|uniref:HvfC/BufC N-terminal domain-containing protein n=1 Tax=Aestuariirhabdus haliotis TaxID=2918751 RepID=UPI00201B4022|nr:DNA-binding domain-containing protein [Aestuariirhabdus haliotis]MCL6417746.1 DNA-binding domain-containing protein [Aestuariirhabdus haliotis]MCL6421685.1 DNA-binding domain-containing protein [Aestuariirhabdus haliotis]